MIDSLGAGCLLANLSKDIFEQCPSTRHFASLGDVLAQIFGHNYCLYNSNKKIARYICQLQDILKGKEMASFSVDGFMVAQKWGQPFCWGFIFKILIGFGGSFLDKRALPVGSFKFHEISTKRY